MSDLKELDLAKVSELTTGHAAHFKEEVNELELTIQDLRSLKEAEEAGKDREDVVKFLDGQINSENIAAYLGIAENDIGELNDILNEINRIEDIDHFDDEKIEIDQNKLIDLVGGTVNEMKEFIQENPLAPDQLEDILSAEKRIKDRKTAKNYLEKQIRKSRVGEDVSEARKDLEKLKEDMNELKSDESLEDVKPDTSEEDEDIGELNEESEDEEEKTDDKAQENDEEVSDDIENSEDDEDLDEEKEEDEENSSENSDELTDLEKKKQIADDLELEMDEDELEAFSLSDLEKIQSEKSHREELIENLAEKGMEEEDLQNSSTSDLEKVAESMDEKEEAQEEHEEMREEAEEDLEMLMGAVRGSQEEEEEPSKNTKEKIQDFKQNLRDKLDRSDNSKQDSNSGINAGSVQEVLDEYRKLNDEEASIKTAHIMKGFLEQSLGIKREMTYKELAETMPTDEDCMNELAEFFLKMHREQYTGKFNVNNSDSVIDTCEEVINQVN